MNRGGHVFYYRKFIPEIPKVDLEKFTYKRISDFGIVPVAYIEGYLPNAETIFMLSFPANKYFKSNVFHETFSSLEDLAKMKNLPWLIHADKVCVNKFKAEEVTEKTKLAAVSYQKNYFLEDYMDLFKDMIAIIEEKEIPVIEFIVKNGGKEYEILYDLFYDLVEFYIWHGSVGQFDYFHAMTESIIREKIVAKFLNKSGLSLREKGGPIGVLDKYIQYLREKEEIKNMKKNSRKSKSSVE